MLDNITIGNYCAIDSKIHRLNPIIKLVSLISILILTFIVKNTISLIFILSFTILNVLMSNVSLKYYGKSLLCMKYLIIFIITINLVIYRSFIIIINPLLQLIIVILNTTILTYTTKYIDLIYGLEFILYPLRIFNIDSRKFSLILFLGLRFIPDVLSMSSNIFKSQASRGIDFKTGTFREKLFALKSMIIPLIINSFRKTGIYADVMEIRLYDTKRSIIKKKNSFNFYDIIYMISNLILFIFLVVKEVFMWGIL